MRYRIKIFCWNCGKTYNTNLLNRPMPRRCKFCGSIKIMKKNSWRI